MNKIYLDILSKSEMLAEGISKRYDFVPTFCFLLPLLGSIPPQF